MEYVSEEVESIVDTGFALSIAIVAKYRQTGMINCEKHFTIMITTIQYNMYSETTQGK